MWIGIIDCEINFTIMNFEIQVFFFVFLSVKLYKNIKAQTTTSFTKTYHIISGKAFYYCLKSATAKKVKIYGMLLCIVCDFLIKKNTRIFFLVKKKKKLFFYTEKMGALFKLKL